MRHNVAGGGGGGGSFVLVVFQAPTGAQHWQVRFWLLSTHFAPGGEKENNKLFQNILEMFQSISYHVT